jgi:hypothetical protein
MELEADKETVACGRQLAWKWGESEYGDLYIHMQILTAFVV